MIDQTGGVVETVEETRIELMAITDASRQR